jgi:hypothetical protein
LNAAEILPSVSERRRNGNLFFFFQAAFASGLS